MPVRSLCSGEIFHVQNLSLTNTRFWPGAAVDDKTEPLMPDLDAPKQSFADATPEVLGITTSVTVKFLVSSLSAGSYRVSCLGIR